MKLHTTLFNILIFLATIFFTTNCSEKGKDQQLTSTDSTQRIDSSYIQSFLTNNPAYKIQGKMLLQFYKHRNHTLVWYRKNNSELIPQAGMLVNMVNAIKDSLPETRFNSKRLNELFNKVRHEDGKNDSIMDVRKKLDLMLTSAYFNYAHSLWQGAIKPQEDDLDWFRHGRKIKFSKDSSPILESKDNPFSKSLSFNPEYEALKTYLEKYLEIEKNKSWPSIGFQGKLIKGDASGAILAIKKLLSITGDLASNDQKNKFDSALEFAVKKFQRRHGLEEDGIVGGKTLEEMSIPISSRIQQIIVNMERRKWVPGNIGTNYITVNVPEFMFRIFDGGKEVFHMNVIVGKSANSTPIFNDELESIVFNPYWNVPESIVLNELLPDLRKDKKALEEKNIEVYQGTPDHQIDPESVDWDEIDTAQLPYQFRQIPGKENALGKIKFLFPNNYDVYLHDTPSRELFSLAKRDFSHGCIRIEKPLQLAEYLLRNEPAWSKEKIDETIGNEEETVVKLSKKIPVFIYYFTSWVDEKGSINFRDDIYGHDEKLKETFLE